MSLSTDGVWSGGVWAPTAWAEGVWQEGGAPPVVPPVGGGGYMWPRRPTDLEILRADDELILTLFFQALDDLEKTMTQ